MKKICMLITGVTFTMFAFSQTTQQEGDKHIQDPKRKENAGKADVIISKKKTIFDSTTFSNDTTEVTNNKAVKSSARKKHCGNKTKRSGKGTSRKKA